MQTFTLTNPMDMHLHLREGEILQSVLPYTANVFHSAVVMPNLKVPITTTTMAQNYQTQILSHLKAHTFEPLMTLYITDSLTQSELLKAKNAGIKILKLYPKGATTGSENGIKEVLEDKTLEIFHYAQDLGFILSIHGESNGFCMEREYEFLSIFEHIARNFPKLQVIIEHLSDVRSLDLIEKYSNLYATLTLHHSTMNLDDVLGGTLNPHHFCKPLLKTKKDQQALLQAALNAHPKISFGSDSAPHLESHKLRANAAAGIFSAPILLPALVEIFESHNALDNLQAFLSQRAIENYALTPTFSKIITLHPKPFEIPAYVSTLLGKIIPLKAGENLRWSVQDITIMSQIS